MGTFRRVWVGCGLLMLAGSAFCQETIASNPFAGNAEALREGTTIFQMRCAACHGSNATGGSGPSLVAAMQRGIANEHLFTTITHGVPGTSMLAYSSAGDTTTDVWKVITYLTSLHEANGAATTAHGPAANITWSDLLAGLKDPHRWLSYSGDLRGERHSPLVQITPKNVANLKSQWTFQTGTQGKFEATPIVIDGVLYITGANNFAWAIDARTGRQIWKYQRELPQGLKPCCGTVNRGFAVLGGKLFMATLDAHLIALDIRDGSVLWDAVMGDYKLAYTATIAPMVVKDKVIAGVGGGEFGVRASVQAFDAATGKLAWKFYTTAAPGEPGGDSWSGDSWKTGGGPVWAPGSYDPETDTLFIGTGNPGPDYNGSVREGDNLYTDSLLALDPATGKLKWYFQFTPHDLHDWDATQTPIVTDLRITGQMRKVVMAANRNGFFYVLDRVTGKHIVAEPFVTQDWASGIGPDGRPILVPGHTPDMKGTATCPDLFGGTNFNPTSYDASLGLVFVSVRERCTSYVTFDEKYVPGQKYTGGSFASLPKAEYGALRAIDAATGKRRWEFKYEHLGFPGVLSTASGLVFAGDATGRLHGFDSRTGKDLWSYQLGWSPDAYSSGTGIFAAPTTFMVGSRQYVLIPSGTLLTAFALP